MDFPDGQQVFRDRRKLIPDPYNPDSTTPGDWDDPDTIDLEGFVASSSSSSMSDATRNQVLTSKSLYLTDPSADVLVGDRIRWGNSKMYVEALPSADVNPFTGWQPVVEIPLSGVAG